MRLGLALHQPGGVAIAGDVLGLRQRARGLLVTGRWNGRAASAPSPCGRQDDEGVILSLMPLLGVKRETRPAIVALDLFRASLFERCGGPGAH
jgi:hypothetical protein